MHPSRRRRRSTRSACCIAGRARRSSSPAARTSCRATGRRSLRPTLRRRRRTPRARPTSDGVGARARLDPDLHVHDRRPASCAERSSRRTAATPTSPAPSTRCRSRIAAATALDDRRRRSRARSATASCACARRVRFDDANRRLARRRRTSCCSRAARRRVTSRVGDRRRRTGRDHGRRTRTESFTLRRVVRVAPGAREQVAFYIAVGPERDGAEATARVLRRRGWRELLVVDARRAAVSCEQTHGQRSDRSARSIAICSSRTSTPSDARSTTRTTISCARARRGTGTASPCATGKRSTWTIPAVQLADAPLARELLLRMCELHGYAPGRGVHYLDGTLFEPGFTLEGVAAYRARRPIATSATRATIEIVDEPVLADTLYLAADDLDGATRRARSAVLDRGESVRRAGGASVHAARATPSSRRRSTSCAARSTRRRRATVEDPDAVRAAIRRHFVIERDGKATLRVGRSISPAATSLDDDPSASALLAPDLRGGRATGLDVSPHGEGDRRRAALARAAVRAAHRPRRDGRAAVAASRAARRRRRRGDRGRRRSARSANGGDASLSGLLAWTVWYAVQRARRAAVTRALPAQSRAAIYSRRTRE